MANRDAKTGRFARPVPGVAAESRFGPMADSIEDIDNVSGAPSGNTIERPRYSPEGDELAQGGQSYRLRPRRPVLVEADQDARGKYGPQGARLRDAARLAGLAGPLGYALGIDDAPGPSDG